MNTRVKLKKNYILLSIAVLSIGFSLTGITFAWYSYNDSETKINAKTIDEKPSIVFTQNDYVESSSIMPIYDEDRYNYGVKNEFTITLPKNLEGYTTTIEINLTDIVISHGLLTEEFKYELLEDGKLIANGNFHNLEGNRMQILPMHIVGNTNLPYSYNYKLIIWLSENNNNQNDLMNKNFKGKVSVTSTSKKEG